MTAKAEQDKAKAANQRMRECMDRQVLHVRCGRWGPRYQRDVAEIRFVGTLAELHGPDGCCSCCHGRKS